MTLRRIDARFLLPFLPETATVLRGAEAWSAALARVGIGEPAADGRPDLVVAGSAAASRAWSSSARAVLVEGARPTAVGWDTRSFLPLPSLTDPAVIVPLDRPAVLRYVARTWAHPNSRVKLVRKRLAVALVGQAASLTRRPTLTVGLRSSGVAQPFLVAGAAGLGVPANADWHLVCGQGDELSRGAFVLFPSRARRPEWVLKFSRASGYTDPFERDERGLGLAASAGGSTAAHAPRLLGRAVVLDHHISLETAAPGGRVSALLRSAVSRRRKERIVDAVADWVLRVGRETGGGVGSAAAEVERLARDLVPSWHAYGVQPSLLDGLERLSGVLQHNDLGSWNIVADDRGRFTVLDWESARPSGLPLWDLLYFLADALTLLDGTAGDPGGFTRLFRGEAPSSTRLFAWTRRAVESLAIPPSAVGAIATTCWLHHGLSRLARADALGRHVEQAAALGWRADSYANAWLSEPGLGPGWCAWAPPAAGPSGGVGSGSP